MFAQVPFREKAKYVLTFGVGLAAMIFIGVSCNKSPNPKITFEDLGPVEEKKAAPPTQPEALVIHVAGAVKKPGVYTLKPNARVFEAIRAAGGGTPSADLDAWNLAAKLKDGMQVYVPTKSSSKPVARNSRATRPSELSGNLPLKIEIPDEFKGKRLPEWVEDQSDPPKTKAKAAQNEVPKEGSLWVNESGIDDLEKVPGIGPSLALAIVEYRAQHGPFKSIDDLISVPGIGPQKLKAIRKYFKL